MLKQFLFFSVITLLHLPIYAQFSVSQENLKEHVFTLASDSLLGRGFGTRQGAIAAKYIAQQFEKAGIEPLNKGYFQPFTFRKGILNISGANVTGIIHGSDPELKHEYIVLGAHYDHIGWKIKGADTIVYNGADDNASGTATLIEIGRNLVLNKESLGRSILIIAFDGEESGLVGSKQFLTDAVVPPEKIKLMFGLDMLGMYEAHGGLDLRGIGRLKDAERITGELASKSNIVIKKASSKTEQRTDTAPFGNAGIPAVAPHTGTESPYHKPEDRAELLDYEGMALVANYLATVTLELSKSKEISDKTTAEEEEEEEEEEVDLSGSKIFRTGIRVNLGSAKHNYPGEFYKGKAIFAAEAGLFTSIRAAKFLTFQPEILYESKGSQHKDGTFRTHSVTTPLNLLITSQESGGIRTYFSLGGYYSYHFGGKTGDLKIDFVNEYMNHEYGITYGFGLEAMNVQIGLYIQKAFSDLNRTLPADDSGMRNENIYFSLGFTF